MPRGGHLAARIADCGVTRGKNQQQREAYGAIWRSILEQARLRGEFRTSANLNFALLYIFGALNWVAEWFRPGGRSIEEIASEFASFILDGLTGNESALTAVPLELASPVQAGWLSNRGHKQKAKPRAG